MLKKRRRKKEYHPILTYFVITKKMKNIINVQGGWKAMCKTIFFFLMVPMFTREYIFIGP